MSGAYLVDVNTLRETLDEATCLVARARLVLTDPNHADPELPRLMGEFLGLRNDQEAPSPCWVFIFGAARDGAPLLSNRQLTGKESTFLGDHLRAFAESVTDQRITVHVEDPTDEADLTGVLTFDEGYEHGRSVKAHARAYAVFEGD